MHRAKWSNTQSRHFGALTVETARRAIADAGPAGGGCGWLRDGKLVPDRRRPRRRRRSQPGLVQLAGRSISASIPSTPRFQGFGQLPERSLSGERSGERSCRLRDRASGSAQPAWQVPRKSDDRGERTQQWTAPQGYFGPLSIIALTYNEYLQRYGAGREAMASVLRGGSQEQIRIPWSYSHEKPLRAEDYLAEPMINDPICRLDCDLPVDGVACFVLTSAEPSARPSEPTGLRGRLRHRGPVSSSTSAPLAVGRCHGGWTGDGPPALGALGNRTGGR